METTRPSHRTKGYYAHTPSKADPAACDEAKTGTDPPSSSVSKHAVTSWDKGHKGHRDHDSRVVSNGQPKPKDIQHVPVATTAIDLPREEQITTPAAIAVVQHRDLTAQPPKQNDYHEQTAVAVLVMSLDFVIRSIIIANTVPTQRRSVDPPKSREVLLVERTPNSRAKAEMVLKTVDRPSVDNVAKTAQRMPVRAARRPEVGGPSDKRDSFTP